MFICWPTVVNGNWKGAFSIATKQICRRGQNSFLWITPLTLDLYPRRLNFKQRGIK